MSAPVHEPEEDRLPYARLVWVSVFALAAFTVGGLWSTWLLYQPTRQLNPERHLAPASEEGKPEVGMVNQRLFAHERRAALLRTDQEARLRSYGWVDRRSGVIHIPVERAMQLLLEEPR